MHVCHNLIIGLFVVHNFNLMLISIIVYVIHDVLIVAATIFLHEILYVSHIHICILIPIYTN